ncbi:MAG: DUF1772 domain-containing protein [Candidatus Saccharimonadales bacterium]
MTFENIVLVIAGTLTALLAGLFFGYAVSVVPAFKRLKDAEYVRAMQAINIAILNPVFFVSFMGPLVLLPFSAFLAWDNDSTARFWLLVCASAVYIVGTFGITAAGNVPLNEKLAKAEGSEKELSAARAAFETSWNYLHNLRTFAAIAATILVFAACLR